MIVVAVVATVVLGTTATVVFNGIEHRTKREQRQQRFDASRGNRLATICIALAVPFWAWYLYASGTPLITMIIGGSILILSILAVVTSEVMKRRNEQK